ncbi:dr1-associated corepressor homolog [Nematostella vectensis]|uniref:dr1-associated corepressor homolog n=1 Tax=Nematostella vectensis TaxID=45351 RepID=UPI0020774CA8|nr:dr1-associated corepressor homolog [Nematostella vectensis]
MYEEDQDVDDNERLIQCPYESKHRVKAAGMSDHLVKCREKFLDEGEKTKCPFNPDHLIFAQEMDCHKMLCSDKNGFTKNCFDDEVKMKESQEEEIVANEATQTEMKPQLNEPSLEADGNSEKAGCVSGKKVGGIEEFYRTVTDEENQTVSTESCEDSIPEIKTSGENRGKEGENFGDNSECVVSHMYGSEPQNHNIPIEKQLPETNSDTESSTDETLSTGVSTEGEQFDSQEKSFDYKKYAPSKEERDQFLKLISQHKKETTSQESEKYDSTTQTYPTAWPPQYYITQPYQGVGIPQYQNMPASYITVTNGYPMMTSVPPQSAYPAAYTFQPGYVQQPGVNYEYGPLYTGRPYRPNYRRRNFHNNHSNGRYNSNHYGHNNYHNNHFNSHGRHNSYSSHNNHYNGCQNGNGYHSYYYTSSNDSHSHGETDSNSSGQSDVSLGEEAICNGNTHYSTSRRQPRNSRRVFPPKNPINLVRVDNTTVTVEKIVHVIDTDDESPPSLNGDLSGSDISPEPLEAFELMDAKKKTEREKLGRKLKKKLCEIQQLEAKKNSGGKLDCDQLKKLSRKRDLEEELASLNLD